MPKKLSYEDFLQSLRLSPRLVIELVVTNHKGEILLTKRSSEPFIGSWHLPGGFLLKDEPINNCVKRISLEEVNLKLEMRGGKTVGLFETIKGDPRGHLLHYVISFKKDLKSNVTYFSKLPKKVIPYQRDILKKLGFK